MPLEILSLEKDPQLWQSAVADLPAGQRDIHLLPEYVRIYRDCCGHRPFLARYQHYTLKHQRTTLIT